ncbi:MAG: hypothetical protein IPN08_19365 [Bacteroidales bacterium]|nr:hypothetical protein [Bacteroidales bacterium]MBK9359500.1 hypothetical protein [Bacteroidales bacterium]
MKKVFLFSIIATLAIFTACKKDDESFKSPEVVAPANLTAESGAEVDITFTFTSEGGFNSSSVSATNGTASIKTNGTAGATSGSIVVTYTAGSNIGAGSVTLTLTDTKNQTGSATAVISVVEEELVVNVNGNITANTTWETGKTYILESRIAVVAGITLTIEPGVIVKGQAGTGANATALLIARGGKLMAEGTASSPIIFTSVADEILPGSVASPNLEPTLNGLWGGLIILGNAPISADASSVQIEGIPPSDQNGLYGGSDASDNSGIIKYVSIRHGGANIGEGNEINGLTLGGVGSGTIIENIEVVANQDDGIEWFGGTVAVKNVIIWNAGDDAVDTDQSWGGTLDNFIVVNPGDECFELDGPEGSMEAGHILKNGTVYAGIADGLVDLDDNSIVEMSGIYFFGMKAGQDFDLNPLALTASDLQATLPDGGVVTDYFKAGSDAFVTTVALGANTVGADVTKFSTWSWAAVSGALTDF